MINKLNILKHAACLAAIALCMALPIYSYGTGSAPANIVMVTDTAQVNMRFAGSGKVNIDWGDGSKPETYSVFKNYTYNHAYSDTSEHTIRIYGENITGLTCRGNRLTRLDVSNNTVLTSLYCSDNQLTALNVNNNTALRYLDCSGNQLTALNVSNNTALDFVDCGSNKLTNLDVSKNLALESLECGSNKLTNLNVSNNTALDYVDCSSNQLTNLNVSSNIGLTYLFCRGNRLTRLDVSKNTTLYMLRCNNNQLTALDVSKNTALTYVYCENNKLSAGGLNSLFGTLHGYERAEQKIICIQNNPGTAGCKRSIATAKDWSVQDTRD